MKEFMYVVFVWFLIQLVMISAAVSMNDLKSAQGTYSCDATSVSPIEAYLMGAFMPMTEFTFVKGDFCWNSSN